MEDWESVKARLEQYAKDKGWHAADIRAALERVEGVEGAMRADDKRLEEAAVRVWGEHRWGCDTPDQMADLILSLRQRVEELEEMGRIEHSACEAAMTKMEQAVEVMKVQQERAVDAEAEVTEWRDTARSEMAGRRAAEAEVAEKLEGMVDLSQRNVELVAEVERLREALCAALAPEVKPEGSACADRAETVEQTHARWSAQPEEAK